MNLFPLEEAVLRALALESTPCAAVLVQQRPFLEVRERTSSAAGFCTKFTHRPSAPITSGMSSRCGEVQARIPGLQHGMAGRVTMLEGYDEEMPELALLMDFAIDTPPRDEDRR